MNIDEENLQAGLIKAEMWLTPLQARVVRAVVEAMRQHAEEGHMPGELAVLTRINDGKPAPTAPLPHPKPKN